MKKLSKKKLLLIGICVLIGLSYFSSKVTTAEGEPFRQQLISPTAGFPPETKVTRRYVRWRCDDKENRPGTCGTKKTGYAERPALRATVVIMGCTVYLDRLPSSETDYAFREMFDKTRRIDVTIGAQPFTRRNPTYVEVQAYLIAAKTTLKLTCLVEQ